MTRLNNVLLHEYTKHSNLMIPFCEYIRYDNYPIQKEKILGKDILVAYNNRSQIVDDNVESPKIIIQKTMCRVLRYDITAPYRCILVSLDGSLLFVADSRTIEDTNTTVVLGYYNQFTELIGLPCKTQYVATTNEYEGIILLADLGEECNSVIMEKLPNGVHRYILGDECFVKLKNYPVEDYKSFTTIAEVRKSILREVLNP